MRFCIAIQAGSAVLVVSVRQELLLPRIPELQGQSWLEWLRFKELLTNSGLVIMVETDVKNVLDLEASR